MINLYNVAYNYLLSANYPPQLNNLIINQQYLLSVCNQDLSPAVTQLHSLLYLYIPQVKITLKIGTSGKNSAVFKPHFPLLKDSETWYDLTPTTVNI